MLFTLDPETAPGLSIAAFKAMPLPTARIDPLLASMVAGIDFPAPLGAAPGYDKNGEVPDGLLPIGFEFSKW